MDNTVLGSVQDLKEKLEKFVAERKLPDPRDPDHFHGEKESANEPQPADGQL